MLLEIAYHDRELPPMPMALHDCFLLRRLRSHLNGANEWPKVTFPSMLLFVLGLAEFMLKSTLMLLKCTSNMCGNCQNEKKFVRIKKVQQNTRNRIQHVIRREMKKD